MRRSPDAAGELLDTGAPAPLEHPGRTDAPAPAATSAGDPPAPVQRATPPSAPAPTPPADTSAFVSAGRITDPQGDAGLEAPPYADIVAVTLEDDGTRARLTVEVAGAVPRRLRDGEVMGIGVDLFTRPDGESAYQVFANGNADGWDTFLHNANGVFHYPGRFEIDQRRLVFEIDWAHLGQLPEGTFTAFIDWSQSRVPVNAASRDRAPDRGSAPFKRPPRG